MVNCLIYCVTDLFIRFALMFSIALRLVSLTVLIIIALRQY